MEKVLNQWEVDPVSVDELSSLTYNNEDCLVRIEDKRVRALNLGNAITLGRHTNRKAEMILSTNQGFRRVSSQIMAINENGVLLENSRFIPIVVIYSVDIPV